MFQKPMDVETSVNWATRPRKGKRTCNYLAKPTNDLLFLPPASSFSSIIDQTVKFPILNISEDEEIKHKKVCLTQKLHSNGRFILRYFTGLLNPALIIGYLHVILNLFLVSILIYSLGFILYYARIDINYKIGIKRAEVNADIEEAKRLYVINRCDPTTRVPAMESQCGKWECVMKNGLSGIKYTKIVAELFADVVDGFVGRLKLRNLGVIIFFIIVHLIFKNRFR